MTIPVQLENLRVFRSALFADWPRPVYLRLVIVSEFQFVTDGTWRRRHEYIFPLAKLEGYPSTPLKWFVQPQPRNRNGLV